MPKATTSSKKSNRATVIALTQAKGGTAKTSSVLNIGVSLAQHGYKTLVVDTDSQANLTQSLGINPVDLEYSMYSLLSDPNIDARDIVVSTEEGVDLLPSNIDLSALDLTVGGFIGREKLLAKKLSTLIGEYEFILIDTPPALSLATTNAMSAANYLLIPVQPVQFCLNGMQNLLQQFESVRDNINPSLEILGVFITLYERITAHREITDIIRQEWGEQAFETVIRKRSNIHDATVENRAIVTYQPNSDLAEDYKALTEEVVARVRR